MSEVTGPGFRVGRAVVDGALLGGEAGGGVERDEALQAVGVDDDEGGLGGGEERELPGAVGAAGELEAGEGRGKGALSAGVGAGDEAAGSPEEAFASGGALDAAALGVVAVAGGAALAVPAQVVRTKAGGAASTVGGELGGAAGSVVDEADGGAVAASGDDAQGAEAGGAVEGKGDLRTGCVEVGMGLAPGNVLVADEVVEGVELPEVCGLVVVLGEGTTAEGAPAGEAALVVVAQGVDALAAGDALAQAAGATAG
ncbi:hypothetical protein L6V77_35555, partial [Myxococcota bacterium]|nr:hypothetical protein [Myxococcota bacterium]